MGRRVGDEGVRGSIVAAESDLCPRGLSCRAAGEGGFIAEIGERPLEAGPQVDLGLPSLQALCLGKVRAAPGRIVNRQRSPLDAARAPRQCRDRLRNVEDGALIGTPEIDALAVDA